MESGAGSNDTTENGNGHADFILSYIRQFGSIHEQEIDFKHSARPWTLPTLELMISEGKVAAVGSPGSRIFLLTPENG